VEPGIHRIARPGLAQTVAGALAAGSVFLVAGPGYGKTMALEEAIALADLRAVWLPCGEAGGEAGRLILMLVEKLRVAVPGLADVVGEGLAASTEPVDVRAAGRALVTELERLMVEPLVIVFDDAEELEGSESGLALVEQLLNVRGAPLSVAIATRRPLPLRLTKLRAAGRATEVGAAELSFSATECEELLRLRRDRPIAEEEVTAVLATSEGWPMGIALTSLADAPEPSRGAVPRAELFSYLAEEVLDRLDPGTRLALAESSVPMTLTPELADSLGLPRGFLDDAERLGLFLRAGGDRPGARTYHPLFREFLLERLRELRTPAERAELHARAAAALAAGGRTAEAVDHWLEAGRFDDALAALAAQGHDFMRTSPDTVRDWLSRLPSELRAQPAYLLLEGQLEWGVGQHEEAVGPLRAAVAGYRAEHDAPREWLARSILADTLSSLGAFDEMVALGADWDGPGGQAAGTSATVVAGYMVIALAILGRAEEAAALGDQLRGDARTAAPFRYLDDIARAAVEPSAGHGRAVLERLLATAQQLDLHDPTGRLPYTMAMIILVLMDLGERAEALDWLDRCERESERVGLGFVARDCQLRRAFLLAREGELSRAELELARAGTRRGTGWRGVSRHVAEAQVAALRGDREEAVTAAERALARVAPGPVCFRVWAAVDLTPVLAQQGVPEIAARVVEATLSALDERFPGDRGRLHRARLLASRAWLEHEAGEPDVATETLRRSWDAAGPEADQVVRAHWATLRPVLWHAIAVGAIAPDSVAPALQRAFPGGSALVALVDHPVAAARRAAVAAALGAGHPAVLSRLAALAKDPDEHVAAAAVAARERIRESPPSLRFELLGHFGVRRAGWEIEEATWGRPMAARVVRFLLVQGPTAVPEDVIFETFWPDRPSDTARQHLAQAVSRARKTLDLPGAHRSVIEARERTYRLRLRDHDNVDAFEFDEAAAEALAHDGPGRRASLERAAGLWTGEPLPEDRYEPWSFAWRERLTERYLDVFRALVDDYEASGDHHRAILAARKLLELDPVNENAHRVLMASYARTGRSGHALRQFLECRRALVDELGVEPSAATARLQRRILAGEAV
jgi:ATP/maltotriose-dependent transcriptional regulator MalT/DNA-binding SARP family transcriptional activator